MVRVFNVESGTAILPQASARAPISLPAFFFTSKSPKRKFSIYFYGPTRKRREITENEIGD